MAQVQCGFDFFRKLPARWARFYRDKRNLRFRQNRADFSRERLEVGQHLFRRLAGGNVVVAGIK